MLTLLSVKLTKNFKWYRYLAVAVLFATSKKILISYHTWSTSSRKPLKRVSFSACETISNYVLTSLCQHQQLGFLYWWKILVISALEIFPCFAWNYFFFNPAQVNCDWKISISYTKKNFSAHGVSLFRKWSIDNLIFKIFFVWSLQNPKAKT